MLSVLPIKQKLLFVLIRAVDRATLHHSQSSLKIVFSFRAIVPLLIAFYGEQGKLASRVRG